MPRWIDIEKSRPGAVGNASILGYRKPLGQEPPTSPKGVQRRTSAGPRLRAPAPPTSSAPELPPIAAKADDLEAIKKAVDDAASVGGGLWLSYLFVLFYLAVAAGAVTHDDLFLEKPVKLPFLNIELPLLAFFFLAPILFIIVHAYTLVHLVMLTDKAKRFHQELRRQIPEDDNLPKEELDKRKQIRTGLRQQLPSNVFVQYLAGSPEIREGAFGWLLWSIAAITLANAPVLLLLLLQVQFLPYHNSFITWTHRIVLLADIVLVWWLWRKILYGRLIEGRGPRLAWWTGWGLGLTFSGAVVFFSLVEATFPGEWQTESLASWQPIHERDQSGNPIMVSVHDWLFESRINETTRRRRWPLSSTLILPGFNIYEGLGIDDPEKAKWHDFVFRARGRDLRGAIFDFAILPKVDFEGADLEAASLDSASLRGASLRGASLRRASLSVAQLEGVNLGSAQLQGANLWGTQLVGAELVGAQIQGAKLDSAYLQGADLGSAKLHGAELDQAWLQGADLTLAELQDASLFDTQLQGARLDYAQLQGASLNYARLQGASLKGAVLEATNLSNTWLWRTTAAVPPDPKPAAVWFTDVSWGPSWRDGVNNPYRWDDEAYQDLRKTIDTLPSGTLRDEALQNISRLDCASPDKTLASCDPSAEPPAKAVAWRKALEDTRVDDKVYVNALANTLRSLVCSGNVDAIPIVRGDGFLFHLWAAGRAAIDFIDDLTNKNSKNCPVAAALTDNDRATLLQIKQKIMAGKAAYKELTFPGPRSP